MYPSVEQMIEDIRESERASNGIELDEWETEFMESLEERVEKKRGLSKKQTDKLEEIWDRA